jgi:sister chromatid cohesion protein DCC1
MHLVSLSQPLEAASVRVLSQSLEREHEVKREVTLQVMRWFGGVDAENESWNVDIEKVVRQVGLGILRQHKVGGVRIFQKVYGILTLFYRMTRCRRTSS